MATARAELKGRGQSTVALVCDYINEARMQVRFAALFRGHPTIVVPDVHQQYSSAHVLTTTWREGLGLEAFLGTKRSQVQRDRLGEALLDFYVGSLYRQGLYNCDPHPGNYICLSDNRLAMLDYGCTREFDRTFVAKLAALTRAVQSDSRSDLESALRNLNLVGERLEFETVRSLLRSFYGPMVHNERGRMSTGDAQPLIRLLQSKKELTKLNIPGEFLFLFRIRFGLVSVLARLGAVANWFQLERQLASAAM